MTEKLTPNNNCFKNITQPQCPLPRATDPLSPPHLSPAATLDPPTSLEARLGDGAPQIHVMPLGGLRR